MKKVLIIIALTVISITSSISQTITRPNGVGNIEYVYKHGDGSPAPIKLQFSVADIKEYGISDEELQQTIRSAVYYARTTKPKNKYSYQFSNTLGGVVIMDGQICICIDGTAVNAYNARGQFTTYICFDKGAYVVADRVF